jgi:hypothetical protein
MGHEETGQFPSNHEEQNRAKAERDNNRYSELALKIIREAARLSRPLDVFDAPSLAKIIKAAHEKWKDAT